MDERPQGAAKWRTTRLPRQHRGMDRWRTGSDDGAQVGRLEGGEMEW